jgi:uncharacterized repeat protein (TIGR03803 family)
MRQKKFWFAISGIVAVLAVALMLPTQTVAASKYKVLYKFTGGADGGNPYLAGLIFDADGNLYGTTYKGGASGDGTVFKLTPNSNGSWTESVLYSFSGGADGANPWAGLIFDAAGKNLYGTTVSGGGSTMCAGGCGTAFTLKPNSDGNWTESVLHSFTGGADGAGPVAGLIFDAARKNLYGTTPGGGASGDGTVFKLTPNSNGSWTESVLYSFTGKPDGAFPYAGLIFDAAGKNLYGTTVHGGVVSPMCGDTCGTAFTLKPNSNGSWTESVLYSFTDADGANPLAGLIFDTAGNLYGTTANGGTLAYCSGFGCGVVFELTPNSDGSWTESVLHRFANRPAAGPEAVLIFDSVGSLWGTAANGGPTNGGAVFKLTPQSGGSWRYSVLHVFLGEPAQNPLDGLVFDITGNLYGTTVNCGGGKKCAGVVFEITP